MLNEQKEFVCDWACCNKPATKILRYVIESEVSSGDPIEEALCDDHAAIEEKSLHEPGRFSFSVPTHSEPVDGMLARFSNETIENYCCNEETYQGFTYTRVGKNVDPASWGLPPESRGTIVVRDRRGRRSILKKLEQTQ